MVEKRRDRRITSLLSVLMSAAAEPLIIRYTLASQRSKVRLPVSTAGRLQLEGKELKVSARLEIPNYSSMAIRILPKKIQKRRLARERDLVQCR